jgi:hypothetical protein
MDGQEWNSHFFDLSHNICSQSPFDGYLLFTSFRLSTRAAANARRSRTGTRPQCTAPRYAVLRLSTQFLRRHEWQQWKSRNSGAALADFAE